MIRGENSDSLPIDLIHEILSRLPAKSIARFRCVSKLWRSMLSRQYFTELFLTRSRARPRFLFALALVRACEWRWSFYSSSQPQNPADEKSSLVLAAHFHMKFRENMWPQFCSLTSGLIYFSDMRISEKNKDTVPVLYNPSTRRLAILPKLRRCNSSDEFLVFDPIDKQFKVLSIGYPHSDDGHRILTLRTGTIMWREIQCPLNHCPLCEGICINGVLYYLAQDIDKTSVIFVFDVRSEKFKFIHVKCIRDPSMFKLINYKGKLGWISLKQDYAGGRRLIDLCVWVLEDVEKHEYTQLVCTFPENDIVEDVSVVGMTASGEIVLAMDYIRKPYYVFYFNPERNTLQSVEIQGLDEKGGTVYAFVDQVEDLNVNDAKFLNAIQVQNSIRKLRKFYLPKKQPAILQRNE